MSALSLCSIHLLSAQMHGKVEHVHVISSVASILSVYRRYKPSFVTTNLFHKSMYHLQCTLITDAFYCHQAREHMLRTSCALHTTLYSMVVPKYNEC